jgi:hypothetical protein
MNRKTGCSRRDFLGRVGGGVAAGAILGFGRLEAQAPAPPKNVAVRPGGRLVPGDLSYLGSFKLNYGGGDYGGWRSGTITYYPAGNGGAGSLIVGNCMTNYSNDASEFTIPTPVVDSQRRPSQLPSASIVGGRLHFDPTAGVMANWKTQEGAFTSGPVLRALGVAQIPGQAGYKLFWGWGAYYLQSPSNAYFHSLGYCDLSPTGTPVSTPRGPWRMSSVAEGAKVGVTSNDTGYALGTHHFIGGTICQVPQAWANAHTNGRSLMTSGHFPDGSAAFSTPYYPCFWGPWFDDPVSAAPAAYAACVPKTGPGPYSNDFYYAGIGHQFTNEAPHPDKFVTWGWRSALDGNFGWPSPEFDGAMTWVTTSDGRVGLVAAASIGAGWGGYKTPQDGIPDATLPQTDTSPNPRQGNNGSLHYFCGHPGDQAHGPVTSRSFVALALFDPNDVVKYWNGQLTAAQFKAYDAYNLWSDLSANGAYDWYRDDATGTRIGLTDVQAQDSFSWSGIWRIDSMTFDPLSRRLYLYQASAWHGTYDPYPLIHVYQVG